MDLDWLLDLWTDRIGPRVPHAELLVYSAAFAAGRPDEDLSRTYAKAREGEAFGVRLLRPLADPDMANAYRTARVHLYPGHAREVYAASLAESQAAGVPAVTRKLGSAPERVKDGRSGYLVPDDEAFVNCAVLLLNDDQVFWARSRDARSMQRVRTWDAAAADVEALAA
jgi:glycosyltransferase involved in cell wall biosynthesis